MRILEIAIENWRNIGKLHLELHNGNTIITGKNGQGKTNLLEAIYTLVNQKSFRTNDLGELITWDCSTTKIKSKIEIAENKRQLELVIEKKRKSILLDGKEKRRDSTELEKISVVVFSPEDLKIVTGSPSQRRKFIDRAIFSSNRSYAKASLEYARCLKTRNYLLKVRKDKKLIESYNEIIAKKGIEIIKQRRKFINYIENKLPYIYTNINEEIELEIIYQTKSLKDEEEPKEEEYIEEIARRTDQDMERGYTSIGPHLDDIYFLLSGKEALKHASQGQIRSIVLGLKIAELQIIEENNNEPPILILDDISSELDLEKRRKLAKEIQKISSQTFISTTEIEQIPGIENGTQLKIGAGKILEEKHFS